MPPGGAIASSRSRDHALQQGGKGAAGGANGPEVALTELSIDRRELVAVLKRRLQRARRFRTLPLALALLCLYIAAIMARGGAAGDALAFDRDLMLNVWGTDSNLGYAQPTSVAGWLAYVGVVDGPDTLLRRAFLSGDVLGAAPGSTAGQGVLPGGGLVVGGAVLSQTRYAPSACPWHDSSASLAAFGAGGACQRAGALSAAPDFFPPALLPAPYPALRQPFAYSAGARAAYVAYTSAYDHFPDTAAFLQDLLASGWVDGATASLTLSAAVLQPDVARIAHARHTVSVTRGGLVKVASRVQSVLLDPYGVGGEGGGGGGGGGGRPATPPLPSLTVGLDCAVVFYLVYIYAGTLKRSARACCGARDASGACGGGGRGGRAAAGALPRPGFCAALCARMPLESALIDWFACGALTAAAVTWAAHAGAAGGVRQALRALPPLAPLNATSVPVARGPGSAPSGPGGEPPWAALEAAAAAAIDSYAAYQTAAALALIGLTLQACKYASFQAHFGVLGATVQRSARDMCHFGWLLVLFMAAFGVWAQLVYGHHMGEWAGEDATGSAATLALVKFIMYDYDLPAMAYADGTGLTTLFYVMFMMGITNIMLWLFFAVLFDSYSLERAKAAQWPSAGAELAAFAASLPHMVPGRLAGCCACCLACGGACGGSGSGGGGARGGARARGACGGGSCTVFAVGGRRHASWGELIASCSGAGALAHAARVTPEMLTAAHGLTVRAAALLIADCAGAAGERARAEALAAARAAAAARGAGEEDAAGERGLERARARGGFYGLGLPGSGQALPAGAEALVAAHGSVAGEPGEGGGGEGEPGGVRGEEGGAKGAAKAGLASEQAAEDAYEAENPAVLARLARMLGLLGGSGGGSGGSGSEGGEAAGGRSGSGGGGGGASSVVGNPMLQAAAAQPGAAGAGAGAGGGGSVAVAADPSFRAWDATPAPALSRYEVEGLPLLPRGGVLAPVPEEEEEERDAGEGAGAGAAGAGAGAGAAPPPPPPQQQQWVKRTTQDGQTYYASVGGWAESEWELPAGGVLVEEG